MCDNSGIIKKTITSLQERHNKGLTSFLVFLFWKKKERIKNDRHRSKLQL